MWLIYESMWWMCKSMLQLSVCENPRLQLRMILLHLKRNDFDYERDKKRKCVFPNFSQLVSFDLSPVHTNQLVRLCSQCGLIRPLSLRQFSIKMRTRISAQLVYPFCTHLATQFVLSPCRPSSPNVLTLRPSQPNVLTLRPSSSNVLLTLKPSSPSVLTLQPSSPNVLTLRPSSSALCLISSLSSSATFFLFRLGLFSCRSARSWKCSCFFTFASKCRSSP